MDVRPALQLREQLRRGSHQKVVLEIDFSGLLWGYTEITIIPTSNELKTIHMHSRQCELRNVTVGGHAAEFVHWDPLSSITLSGEPGEPPDSHKHPELKRKLYSALAEGDEGELSIAVPKDVQLMTAENGSSNGFGFNGTSTPEPMTPGQSQSQQSGSTTEFKPLVVKIEYYLRNPSDGIEFVIPSDAHPYAVPHVYTTPSCPDAARCWVPCIDNPWEKCTWEFEFVVPRYLEEEPEILRDNEPADMTPTVVACSGELVEQVAHPYNSNKSIFLFSQAAPTSIQHIAFAAGPFHIYTIPRDAAEDAAQQPLMHAFCLPGHESSLPHTVSALRHAMSFYSTEFGSYPFGSYKVVFVDELPTQRFDASTMSLIPADVIHGDDALEQAMETRQVLSHALACQWVGIHIQPKAWSDLWLVNGLALYITGLFLRKLFGTNEYRFRMKKDMERVTRLDDGRMPPICQPESPDPPDSRFIAFINLKSPLVLHILDRRLCKSGTSLGLSRVLPKIFLTAISGEMQNNALSTHHFLRICRKVSGADLRAFAEQWIYSSGCPSFGVTASFNRKKMAVEIVLRQECQAWIRLEHDEVLKTMHKPQQFFEGQMTIRIHEADGTPYEHVLDIRSAFKRYEVPFNTKYKRVRRNTKRYIARQAAAQAAAEGDAEAAEAMGMIDIGFGLDIWEKEKERENWKVVDWTEEDEGTMSGATYEWIRMDADFEWISALKFDQPDFMWVSQLQRDRDVVAQLEAVYALSRQPTGIVSSTLTKTVLVSNYHYRIRCEAALALVQCAVHSLDFIGLFHLFKLFLRYCYEPEDPNQDLFTHTYVPKPNDFSDIAEYFVRKSIINAISNVRFETNGKSPGIARRFLNDQLRYNDNTANLYSDGFYICTIISALACATVPTAPPERGELLPTEVGNQQSEEDIELLQRSIEEVERYRSMDRLIPSAHNIVTIAALEFHLILTVAGLVPSNSRVFFPSIREGNYTPVRIAAFDGLFMTKWFTPKVMQYVLAVMANDSSRIIRRHVARSFCQSLALLTQLGEMKAGLKDSETLLIEEDGSHPDKAKEPKKTEVDQLFKVIRKDKEIGKSDLLRTSLMSIALAPHVDHDVRWCVLKLLDVLVKGSEEVVPSVIIHIPLPPPTPVSAEAPPANPVLKIPSRPIKIPTPVPAPTKTPLITLKNPAKVKLSAPSPISSKPSTPKIPKTTMPPIPPSITQVPKGQGLPASVLKLKGKGRPSKPPLKSTPKGVRERQTGKMSQVDLTGSQNLVNKLKSHKCARWFLKPVDPVRDLAPNYYKIITNPMDLGTISSKLSNGKYQNRSAVRNDFKLMIQNAKTFNSPGNLAFKDAIGLEMYFDKQWATMNRTIESIEARDAASITHSSPSVKVLPPVPIPTFSPPPPGPPQRGLKLKLGGNKAKPSTSKKAPVDVESHSKEPPRKVRMIKEPVRVTPPAVELDAPPPPYIDDGSHDILQEVLAIEREQSKHKPQEKVANPAKRKRPTKPSEEDQLLTDLAAPSSKKERTSSTPTTPASTSASAQKLVVPKPNAVKIKKEKQFSTSVSATPSIKGKEREVTTPVIPPLAPSPRKNKDPINERRCRDVLKAMKVESTRIFQRPVDPVADQCPTYLDEIKHPMDLGTMSEKLSRHEYKTMGDFEADIHLIFANCRQFNPPATFPTIQADAAEAIFNKEWAKAMDLNLTTTEKRGLQSVLKAMEGTVAFYWLFSVAVDPVVLQIPTYFDVIPKEDARDLGLVKKKLDSNQYPSVDAFEDDVHLMFYNAVTFNGAESDVGKGALEYQAIFDNLMSNFKTGGSKKRANNEKDSQPTKKVRHV